MANVLATVDASLVAPRASIGKGETCREDMKMKIIEIDYLENFHSCVHLIRTLPLFTSSCQPRIEHSLNGPV